MVWRGFSENANPFTQSPKQTHALKPKPRAGMDEMEFTEAESNMNDLVSEYQQYQADPTRMVKPA